jgi:2,3-bisphosphoglycerate-independent phosphoglycerate mutase
VVSAPGQRLLVIPDGLAEALPAPDRPDAPPTTLAATRTLALDQLARRGAVRPVAVTPEGLHPGSETGISLLLGWTPATSLDRRPHRVHADEPPGTLSRGRIDAAARGIHEPDGAAVHRIDVRHDDGRPWPELGAAAEALLRGSGGEEALHVQRLDGHKLVVFAVTEPLLPPRADLVAAARMAGVAVADDDRPRLQLWPDGAVPPPILDEETVVVCAPRSTAAGIARIMGAETLHPRGATGDVGSDLAAKARAATALLRDGVPTVVVHVGAPDEAAHRHDPALKARELQRLDRDLLAPLAGVALDLGATVAVCPDHGSDPRTGRHTADPVPALLWGPGVPRSGPDRMTEAGVAGLAPVAGPWD